MNPMHRMIALAMVVVVIASKPTLLSAQTAQCGGGGGSAFIRPSVSNVNALIIYAYFPSGGFAGTEQIPSFAPVAAQHLANYYDELSYNAHHVNAQIFRDLPDFAFLANNPVSYYRSGFGSNTKLTELNTEILNKAYQEDSSIFNGISVVFMFYGGDVFNGGTAWAQFNETTSNYSGCGAIIEWGFFGGEEEDGHKWHLAHEYGHLLSPDGTAAKQLLDQTTNQPGGIYNIMYNIRLNGTQSMAAFNLIHLGWIKGNWIKEIDPAVGGDQLNVNIKNTRLAPASGSYNVARIKIPNTTNEHFIVENRQGTGSDAFLSTGGKGLIVWHMNKPFSSYNTNGSMDVEIANPIGAHGQDWLDNGVQKPGESRGFTTDFFDGTNKTKFAPWTNPSTETGYLYSGAHSFRDIAITKITKSGTTMKFDFLANAPPGPPQNLVMPNANQNGQKPFLQWSTNTEPDFNHYQIFRGGQDTPTSPIDWNAWGSGPIATTTSTTWNEPLITIDTSSPSSVHYRITAVDNANNVSDYSNSVSARTYQIPKTSEDQLTETNPTLPTEFSLHQNYPNPFNPITEIKFDLPENGHVTLTIFNVAGRKTRTLINAEKSVGSYSALWDSKDESGRDVASGVYLYSIHVVRSSAPRKYFTTVKKLTLIR